MLSALKWTGIVGGTLALMLLALYWLYPYGRTPMSEMERTRLKATGEAHEFAPLDAGVTHYRLSEPEAEAADRFPGAPPVVVLIHGFLDPVYQWDAYHRRLTAEGYRVVSYDMFGRGFSDRVPGPYDLDLYTRQIGELLDRLGIEGRVHLVGYSMGGMVAAGFADRQTEKVRSLTLIAPAGFSPNGTEGPASALFTAPVIGDLAFRLLGPVLFKREPAATADLPFAELFNRQLAYRGTADAMLSALRHTPFSGQLATYRRIGRSTRPVLIIWGEEDRVAPLPEPALIEETLPRARIVMLDGAGHQLLQSDRDTIGAAIDALISAEVLAPRPSGISGKPRGPLARKEARPCDCKAPDADAAAE